MFCFVHLFFFNMKNNFQIWSLQKWNNLFTFSRSKALVHFHCHLIICFSSTHRTWGLCSWTFSIIIILLAAEIEILWMLYPVCIKDNGRTNLLCVLRLKYSLRLKNIQPCIGHNPLTFKVSIPGLKQRSLHCMSQPLEPISAYWFISTFWYFYVISVWKEAFHLHNSVLIWRCVVMASLQLGWISRDLHRFLSFFIFVQVSDNGCLFCEPLQKREVMEVNSTCRTSGFIRILQILLIIKLLFLFCFVRAIQDFFNMLLFLPFVVCYLV